jgi:predicted exporter
MNKPTHKAKHIAKSLNKATARPKLGNKYGFANTQKRIKIVANLKDKMTEKKKTHGITTAIRNVGTVLMLKFLSLNKISSKLKINRFKNPHYA